MRQFLFILFVLLPLAWLFGMSSIFLVLLIGITMVPVLQFIKCYSHRNNKKRVNRSFSFGFKSIRAQVNEFKSIDNLKFLPVKFRVFCKKYSVANDLLFKSKEDYFGDQAYSASILNMYHDNKRHY
jgi:predicted membrane metal-binding protein